MTRRDRLWGVEIIVLFIVFYEYLRYVGVVALSAAAEAGGDAVARDYHSVLRVGVVAELYHAGGSRGGSYVRSIHTRVSF